MTALLTMLLVSIFAFDYFAFKLELISSYFTLVPEIFSALIALLVIARYIVRRRWEQPVRYVWLFVAFFLVCMIGAVAEAVDPGPLVAGLRYYFKFLPLLLLPAVYRFSDKQLRFLLGVFLLIAGLQVPLAFFQRFVQFSDLMHTGDPVTGTAATSSSLSIVLCMAIALIMTLYIHRKIALPLALVLFCFLAAPTAINETKATLLLLPLATVGPFFLASGIDGKWRKAIPVIGICVFGLITFAAVYNSMMEARWGGTGVGEFLSGAQYESYLYRGVELGENARNIGRFDSIILPIRTLSDDWMQLLFGLGIGNVSPSSIPGMEGAYFEAYKGYGFGMTAVGNMIWEIGLVGLCIYLLFFMYIWRDSRRCVIIGGESRWYCAWWSVCVLIFSIGLVYKSILTFNELGYMLFFWSGVMASSNWRLIHLPDDTGTSKKKIAPRLQLAGRDLPRSNNSVSN